MKKLRLAIIIFIFAAICSSCDHDQHYGLTHQAFDAYIINETDQLIILYTTSDSLALPPQQKTFLANTVLPAPIKVIFIVITPFLLLYIDTINIEMV